MTKDSTSRRNFVTGVTTGLAVSATSGGAASAQDAVSPINPDAKALMPDGNLVTREEILKQLNLDPNIAPEAWLAITNCGANMAASPDMAIIKGLQDRTIELNEISKDKLIDLKNSLKQTEQLLK